MAPGSRPADDHALTGTPLLGSSHKRTGSYGIIPQDGEGGPSAGRGNGTRTDKKSRRRHSVGESEEPLIEASPSTSPRRRSVPWGERSKRRQSTDVSGLEAALERGSESGLEARFTGSGLPSVYAPSSHANASIEALLSSAEISNDEDDNGLDDEHDSSPGYKKSQAREPTENSPYAQVRASVSPLDNLSLSINTPRMWALSIFFSFFGSSTNLFFSLRYPSVSITPIIALLVAHPLGLLWDHIFSRPGDPKGVFLQGVFQGFPDEDVDDDSIGPQRGWKERLRLWLAQGSWNEKEHCCVFISSNVSFGFAFATDVIVEQNKFYHQEVSITYQILLTISTQILGYAMAGITRRFLVRPSGMIWPGTLVSTAMFISLHKDEDKPADGWRISRFKFFLWVFLGSVAFYFLPGLLFPALSWFSVITWFAPKNVIVANLFGVASGLGLFPLTFDWSQIAYIGSPLVVPFWAALNIITGLVIVMWVLAPLMYYANVLYSSHMPILSVAVFDNRGKPYDVSKILTKDFVFDEQAYKDYSRVFLPITYVLSYALQFAALSALITHTACWHGKDIWRHWKDSLSEIRGQPMYQQIPARRSSSRVFDARRSSSSLGGSEPGIENMMNSDDIHNRLMQRYEDVPIFWYLLTGAAMLAIGIFVVEYYPVHLPWYGLLMALGICIVLFIPIGIVMAITNQQTSLYLICQLICGYVFPGRPVANMVFVTYQISSTQGLKFSSDLKLGHYMKIPPKILFYLQLTATIVSSITQIGVLNWMFRFIPRICTADAMNGFTCPIARVHFNGSILWGVVGPTRFFGPGALYSPLVWAFLVGAIAPVLVWLAGRRSRRHRGFWQKVNLPVLFGSLSWIPPATGLNFSVWALVCYLFNDVIRKRKKEWWTKYTMTLSAALDSGLAVGVVLVFFGVVFPGWMDGFKWWGTEVYKQGCDWKACAYKPMAPGERFGPPQW
ncbi:OPT-domain-containing protein [Trichodelitschia bisporula]|uniref:OPT-domain-containing protein n=1 Tax=Trichodelitschia bisporula TaxID=703511 RepID=A0A6G1HQE4_9PEZI|nr:OPT-domain-containing protein [Trichodelitschia bisporula]